MSAISAQLVRELRDRTGAGMMDCKKALESSAGDLERAIEELRKKGLKNVEKRAERVAAEGAVVSYVHPGGRVGVILELNSETDFVARGEKFIGLARELAMHIAWAKPTYVSRSEVPAEIVAKEEEILRAQLSPEQQKMADKIIAGRLEKFYESVCLLEQIDAKEASGKKRMKQLIDELSATVGEKIEVRRFQRFEVGEGIEKNKGDFAAEVASAAGTQH